MRVTIVYDNTTARADLRSDWRSQHLQKLVDNIRWLLRCRSRENCMKVFSLQASLME